MTWRGEPAEKDSAPFWESKHSHIREPPRSLTLESTTPSAPPTIGTLCPYGRPTVGSCGLSTNELFTIGKRESFPFRGGLVFKAHRLVYHSTLKYEPSSEPHLFDMVRLRDETTATDDTVCAALSPPANMETASAPTKDLYLNPTARTWP